MGCLAVVLSAGTLVVTWWSCVVARNVGKSAVAMQQKEITISVASSESYQARMAYEEIRDILNNPESPMSAQAFALGRFVEAMRATATEVSSTGSSQIYPNAQPLKKLFQQYMRAHRGPLGSTPEPRWGDIGGDIIELIHKMGPTLPENPTCCLWNLSQCRDKKETDGKTWKLSKGVEKTDPVELDLTHVSTQDFVGLQAPFLFQSVPVPVRIIFPDNADFGSANLSGSRIAGSRMRKAIFRDADLRNADLSDTVIEGAVFDRADLSGTKFARCVLTNCSFADSKFSNTDFSGAVGLDLKGRSAEGAILPKTFSPTSR